nr:protein transport protein SEC23 [Tanacetum cinerariifolium]
MLKTNMLCILWFKLCSFRNRVIAQEGRSAATLAACRTLAEELTEMSFQACRILAFREASSQAKYFVSRLYPAHKDPL